MHHDIAGAERGGFRNIVLRAALFFAGAHQAVAQNVLFADDGERGRDKALLQRQHGERNLVAAQRQGMRQC